MVTMWHFGFDTPSYNEANSCLTWKDAQGVLLREYSKKKEGKLRRERQEYPKTSLDEAAKKKMSDNKTASGTNGSLNGYERSNSLK